MNLNREKVGALIAYSIDWPPNCTILRAGGTVIIQDNNKEYKITVEELEPVQSSTVN